MTPVPTARMIPVAIIGMAGIFPEAQTLRDYWHNIITGHDCMTDVPPSRWSIDDYYDPDSRTLDKTYCKRGGFLPEIDFYPSDFGLPPSLLEVTDTSQLLGLFVARQLLEEAGYGEGSNHEQTAVILGATGPQKLIVPLISRLQYPVLDKVLQSTGIAPEQREQIIEGFKRAYINWNESTFPGLLGNIIAGRIANRLDLGGTNCIVDAACASSFAALKMALSELTDYRCDMVITGGIDTDNSIVQYLGFSKTPTFSHHHHPRPFDTGADGMLISEGIGMVLLKRLEDVDPQRDTVYAVIKGMGTSSDGRHMSIYAPYAGGQVRALQRAYENAAVSPATIGLIEAHGTGTAAGDKTEVKALREIFEQTSLPPRSIALGSVKSQIGHTKAAAGVMGLIKATLALHHQVLPPTINVTQPDPQLALDNSPFYLNTETRPWIHSATTHPRRAAISSFGFGGTNYHVILEEHQPDQPGQPDDQTCVALSTAHTAPLHRIHEPPHSILLAAETPAALLAICRDTVVQLQSEDAAAHYATLTSARPALPIAGQHARLGCVVASVDELREVLRISIDTLARQPHAETWSHPQGIFYRQHGLDTRGSVVALFSGQGAQYLNMGRDVALNFAVMRHACRCMDRRFQDEGLTPLSEILFPTPVFRSTEKQQQTAALHNTRYAQPALAVFSASLYTILHHAGFCPDMVAGHSFGELSALWAAGVVSADDYFTLAATRGHAMATLPAEEMDAGAMLAVSGSMAQIHHNIQSFETLTIANWNSPRQVVLAGPTSTIASAHDTLRDLGYHVVRLPVSAAFHTSLVRHAQQPFATALQAANFHAPQVPVYSNVSGQCYPTDPAAIRQMLEQHLLQPVQFQHEIENIYADGGRIFVEFGPRSILTTLISDIVGERPHLAVALNERQHNSDRQLREAIVQLQVAGLAIQPPDAHANQQYRATHQQPTPHKGRPVRLSGSNYVSDKTRQAFEQTLQKKEPMTRLDTRDGALHTPVQEQHVNSVHTHDPATLQRHTTLQDEPPYQRLIESSERALHEVGEHLQALQRTREKRVDFQMEYARTLMQMLQHRLDSPLDQEGRELIGQVVTLLREQQEAIRHIQEHDEQTRSDYTRLLSQALQQHQTLLTACVTTRTDGHQATPPPPQADQKQRDSAPTDLLAMLPAAPAPGVTPQPPTGTERTGPGSEMARSNAHPPAPAHSQPAPVAPSAPAATPAPATDALAGMSPVVAAPHILSDAEMQTIAQKLLEVVVEKTGHPADIIRFDVDMEAELSIDSIKRFEILVAMEEYMDEHFPTLPRPDDESRLAHLNTLDEIVTYVCGV